MSEYEIWIGADNEKLEFECSWPTDIENIPEAKRKLYVKQIMRFTYFNDFVDEWKKLCNDPPSMWYWVFDHGERIASGAIAPDDVSCYMNEAHRVAYAYNKFFEKPDFRHIQKSNSQGIEIIYTWRA